MLRAATNRLSLVEPKPIDPNTSTMLEHLEYLKYCQPRTFDLLDKAVDKLKVQIAKVGGVQNINEDNMPEAHIRGDINTQYRCIGAAIITMQQAGFQRVGFISQPNPTENQ